VRGRDFQVERKNVRSGDQVYADAYRVEIRKTRSQIGGGLAGSTAGPRRGKRKATPPHQR
jgi:hypothetical protein